MTSVDPTPTPMPPGAFAGATGSAPTSRVEPPGVATSRAGLGDPGQGVARSSSPLPGDGPKGGLAPPAIDRGWTNRVLAGRYALRAILGEGGMGTVYRAHQLGVGRDVALKVLRPSMAQSDPHVTELFFREARAAAKLNHPHIVTVYDFGRTNEGLLYLAMELVQGASLAALLTSTEIELSDRLRIAIQICRALAEAHACGVVHRDVKPDNVIVSPRRWDPCFVKVLDFGLVKVVGSGFESGQTGMRFGTPLYMSPEQILGRPMDHRADIYALGVLFFELFAGRPPFTGRTPLRVCMQHVETPPPRMCDLVARAALPTELDALVQRMLAKDPLDRPQDVDEVRLTLRTILEWERAIGPTTRIRRPEADPEARARADRSPLRHSQPITLGSALHAALREAAADPHSERRAEAEPSTRIGGDDPQAMITQLVVDRAHYRRGTSAPTGPRPVSGRLSPRIAAEAKGAAEGGADRVAPPRGGEAALPPSKPRTLKLAPEGKPQPEGEPQPEGARTDGARASGGAPVLAPTPATAPATPVPRAHPPATGAIDKRRARRRALERADYAARVFLAILVGASVGLAAMWALVRAFPMP